MECLVVVRVSGHETCRKVLSLSVGKDNDMGSKMVKTKTKQPGRQQLVQKGEVVVGSEGLHRLLCRGTVCVSVGLSRSLVFSMISHLRIVKAGVGGVGAVQSGAGR